MGMFDTIQLCFPLYCTKCKKYTITEGQTKDLGCELNTYLFPGYIPQGREVFNTSLEMYLEVYFSCGRCHSGFEKTIKLKRHKDVFVGHTFVEKDVRGKNCVKGVYSKNLCIQKYAQDISKSIQEESKYVSIMRKSKFRTSLYKELANLSKFTREYYTYTNKFIQTVAGVYYRKEADKIIERAMEMYITDIYVRQGRDGLQTIAPDLKDKFLTEATTKEIAAYKKYIKYGEM